MVLTHQTGGRRSPFLARTVTFLALYGPARGDSLDSPQLRLSSVVRLAEVEKNLLGNNYTKNGNGHDRERGGDEFMVIMVKLIVRLSQDSRDCGCVELPCTLFC